MLKLTTDRQDREGNWITNGTHLQGHIEVSPARLIELFGPPSECDGYKVSGQYVFQSDNGVVATLYDWKSTTLYDEDCHDSPEAFWRQTHAYDFHIGGHSITAVAAVRQLLNTLNEG